MTALRLAMALALGLAHCLPAAALALAAGTSHGPVAAAAPAGGARAPVLRMAVDTSTAMPMAQLVHGEVVDGIQHDLALALARQLGTTARLIALPRKRVAVTLEKGEADLACHFLPAWLPGQLDWTIPFLPNATLLVTRFDRAAPNTLEDLRGVPVGTVLGFAYPEVQDALGAGFVRDDAGDSLQNLTKFAAGRSHHALANEVFFLYQQRLHPNLLQVQRPLLVARFEARCAVARRGRHGVARINDAIRALQKSGQLGAIYARYRPPA